MKTYSAKVGEVERRWHIVDAEGKVLGRLASEVAKVLRGKNKPQYTPHIDTGDFVVVVNAAKVKVTGKKETDKIYYRHTGWVGSVKEETVAFARARHPERIVENAVWGMLPRGTLGRNMFKKLKVYPKAEHPHAAQKPEPLAV